MMVQPWANACRRYSSGTARVLRRNDLQRPVGNYLSCYVSQLAKPSHTNSLSVVQLLYGKRCGRVRRNSGSLDADSHGMGNEMLLGKVSAVARLSSRFARSGGRGRRLSPSRKGTFTDPAQQARSAGSAPRCATRGQSVISRTKHSSVGLK